MLWSALKSRSHFEADDRLRRNVRFITFASLAMGAVVWLLTALLASYLLPTVGALRQAAALALVLTAGLVVYALAIQVTGVMRWGEFLRRLVRR